MGKVIEVNIPVINYISEVREMCIRDRCMCLWTGN